MAFYKLWTCHTIQNNTSNIVNIRTLSDQFISTSFRNR